MIFFNNLHTHQSLLADSDQTITSLTSLGDFDRFRSRLYPRCRWAYLVIFTSRCSIGVYGLFLLQFNKSCIRGHYFFPTEALFYVNWIQTVLHLFRDNSRPFVTFYFLTWILMVVRLFLFRRRFWMVAERGFVTVFNCRLLLLDQMLFKLLEWLDLFTECVDEWLQFEWVFHPISIQKFCAFSTRQLLSTTFDGVNENLFWFHERPVPRHIVFQNLPFQQIVCFFAEMVRLYLW